MHANYFDLRKKGWNGVTILYFYSHIKPIYTLFMGRNFCFLGLLLLFLLRFDAQAQIRLDFDVLSIDDGFTSSRANAIIQDRKGFIWVGTWNGLNRFDGYECVVYQPGYRDETTLSNREVTALLEDSEGFIWIGTTFGLNKLNPITNELTVYPFAYRILSLFEDHKGRIWVGTLDDG